jgi:hypothetical protein
MFRTQAPKRIVPSCVSLYRRISYFSLQSWASRYNQSGSQPRRRNAEGYLLVLRDCKNRFTHETAREEFFEPRALHAHAPHSTKHANEI